MRYSGWYNCWTETAMHATPADADLIDSRTAWRRLLVTLALMTVGAAGMYVVPVVLPAVQADFGVARADASLPYTLAMIGYLAVESKSNGFHMLP